MSSLHKEWKGNGRRKTESETNCREGEKNWEEKGKIRKIVRKEKKASEKAWEMSIKEKNLTKSKSIFILYRIFIRNNNCIKYSKLKTL